MIMLPPAGPVCCPDHHKAHAAVALVCAALSWCMEETGIEHGAYISHALQAGPDNTRARNAVERYMYRQGQNSSRKRRRRRRRRRRLRKLRSGKEPSKQEKRFWSWDQLLAEDVDLKHTSNWCTKHLQNVHNFRLFRGEFVCWVYCSVVAVHMRYHKSLYFWKEGKLGCNTYLDFCRSFQ